MVATTQSEMKKLLGQQYAVAVTKSITSLLLAGALTVGIPLVYKTKEDVDKVVNGLGFVSSCLLSVYAYINSYSVKELGGKFKMFTELEKERFIQEQVFSQQLYLEQVKQQYQPQFIEPEIYHSEPSQDMAVTQANHHNAIIEPDVIITESSQCPHCNSSNISKNGTIEGKQRYKCKDCNKTFGE